MRLQAALEGATTAAILAAAAGLVIVYLVRDERVSAGAGLALAIGCVGIVALGAIIGAARRIPARRVAARIDRASGLSDRIGTAYAFEHALRQGADAPPETVALMRAAVNDAVAAAPRADVRAATPFRRPAEARAAVAFGVVCLAIGGLFLPPHQRDPLIGAIDPARAPHGAVVEVQGVRLCGFEGRYADPDGSCLADSRVSIYLGEGVETIEAEARAWETDRVLMVVPDEAPLGETVVWIQAGDRQSEPHRFVVIDPSDPRYRDEPAVSLEEDDLDYTRDLLRDLERTAQREKDDELQRFVDEVDDLLEKAEKGEISKEQLLEKLAEAEQRYNQGTEEDAEESLADLQKTGRELEKERLTRELGKALEKGDLQQAQKEMEKLAEKLENQELSDEQREKVAKALEEASEKFEERQQERDERRENALDRMRKEVKRLKKERDEAEDEQEEKRLSKKLDKKKRELKKLQREKERRQKSAQKRALKRLHRNMKKASDDMRQSGQEKQRQASRRMKDMARDTGEVDDDIRKIRNRKKVASQMTDLKEALRRARQKNRGPKDLFGKNRKNRDFERRARGGQGRRGAWKPGQKKGRGKAGQKSGGQGKKPGGDSYGTGHDPDLLGDSTPKSGNTTDESVSGAHGRGPSMRETVLSAAQKGFASKQYENVYTKYKEIVEEVIKAESVPSGYKYYVKRYFQKIKPHAMD